MNTGSESGIFDENEPDYGWKKELQEKLKKEWKHGGKTPDRRFYNDTQFFIKYERIIINLWKQFDGDWAAISVENGEELKNNRKITRSNFYDYRNNLTELIVKKRMEFIKKHIRDCFLRTFANEGFSKDAHEKLGAVFEERDFYKESQGFFLMTPYCYEYLDSQPH